jgi:hypothetical protein
MMEYLFSQSYEHVRKSEPQNRRMMNAECRSGWLPGCFCGSKFDILHSAVQRALKVLIYQRLGLPHIQRQLSRGGN